MSFESVVRAVVCSLVDQGLALWAVANIDPGIEEKAEIISKIRGRERIREIDSLCFISRNIGLVMVGL
jgi:hypothetical protein